MRPEQLAWLLIQLVAYGWLGAACARLLRAGRLEARGSLERARAGARAGGLAGGAAALSLLAGWLLAWLAGAASFDRASALAAVLAASSGLTALLAGLSGKPRPGGGFAAALWAASAALALVAARGACC